MLRLASLAEYWSLCRTHQWLPQGRAARLAAAVAAVTAAALLVRHLRRRAKYRLPPGPFCWPLVGDLSLLKKAGRQGSVGRADQLAKDYGDMVTVSVGPNTIVLVLGPDLVQEALLSKQLSNRGSAFFTLDYFTENMNDIFAAPNDKRWRYHRKSAYSAFRMFAQGDKLENFIVDSFDSASKYMTQQSQEPIDVYSTIYLIIYNLQCRMTFSREYTPQDPEFIRLRDSMELLNGSFLGGLLADFVPPLRYLPLGSNRRFLAASDYVINWARQLCEDRKQKFNPGELNDILDYLFFEQKTAFESGQGHLFQDIHMRQTLLDIFTAGTDTSSLTLYWTVWALCDHPEMQARCYEEIRSVFGDSTPRLSERHRLPYTDAFLHEVMRFWPLVSMIPRECHDDYNLGGFLLPQGTQVMLSIYRCHYDPASFPDPTAFKPEHFLTDDGQLAPHKRGFLAFGSGTRVCLGESIAKKSIFLITTMLVQSFEFVQCPEDKGADGFSDDCNALFFLLPRRFKVRVRPRSQQ